jgi:hypothetical protein
MRFIAHNKFKIKILLSPTDFLKIKKKLIMLIASV